MQERAHQLGLMQQLPKILLRRMCWADEARD